MGMMYVGVRVGIFNIQDILFIRFAIDLDL